MQFLIEYGYLVIFFWVLLDQAGLPLPAAPLLLAAGALAGIGELSFFLIILTTLLASVPMDSFWYWLGHIRGGKVLNLLCSISLEPDYCVRNTEQTFYKYGSFSLLVAKFIPGMQTLAPPLAGMVNMNLGVFLLMDALGSLIYALVFTFAGYLFHNELEIIARNFSELGALAGYILLVALTMYIGGKLVQRRMFLRSLRMRRLQPPEVSEMLDSDRAIQVIDLRHDYDYKLQPFMVPNAIRVPMEAIDLHHHRIPKDSDIILYCS